MARTEKATAYHVHPHRGRDAVDAFGVLLRAHGLYHSHIEAWRGQPARTAARAERERVDHLTRLQDRVSELEQELAASQRTVTALGKAFELLDAISKSSATTSRPASGDI